MKALSPLRLLAVPAVVILALPGCKKTTEARMDPEWWNLEADRVELAHKVELMEVRLAKIDRKEQDVAAANALLDREVERLAELKEQAASLEAELAAISESAEQARAEWVRRARGESLGQSFALLSGSRGKTYKNVVITRVTDIGIEFRHADGSARLAAADLTLAQRDTFGLDAGVAGEALKEERAVATAYENWVDERVASNTAKEEAAEIARVAAEASRPKPEPVVAAVDTTSKRSRLRDEPRYFGRSYTTWYPSYTSYRSCYPYRSYGYGSYSAARAYPSASITREGWGCSTAAPVLKGPSSSFGRTP